MSQLDVLVAQTVATERQHGTVTALRHAGTAVGPRATDAYTTAAHAPRQHRTLGLLERLHVVHRHAA